VSASPPDAIVHEGTAPSRPIRLVTDYDLNRSRLIVFFRLLLALPHFVWLTLWRYLAVPVSLINWVATLVMGRSPEALHNFFAALVRYSTHVGAFVSGAANQFPGFVGAPGTYPIDVRIGPPAPQNRWKTFFRLFLAIPAFMIGGAISFIGFGAAVLGWFAALILGRMPAGFEHALAYGLGYQAQLSGYLSLLTDRYPCSDPGLVDAPAPVPAQAVELIVTDDLRRSRLTVFFRVLLALPHIVWVYLWTILAGLAALIGWFVALFTGRLPGGFHRFNAAYVRYATQMSAFLMLLANPFPGFVPSDERPYPVDLRVAEPVKQPRLTILFRLILAIPALILSYAYWFALFPVAFLGWWASLITGRMPGGLRDFGVAAQAYSARYGAYSLLLTGTYPYSGPTR
jgi:uncharacterized protein DUF4389